MVRKSSAQFILNGVTFAGDGAGGGINQDNNVERFQNITFAAGLRVFRGARLGLSTA